MTQIRSAGLSMFGDEVGQRPDGIPLFWMNQLSADIQDTSFSSRDIGLYQQNTATIIVARVFSDG